MSLSLLIPSALLLLGNSLAFPLTPSSTPAMTPDNSPILSPELMSPRASKSSNSATCGPGGLFDLSIFSLQLPTGSAGNIDEIASNELSGCNGWQNKNTFYASDGVLVMKVPGSSDSSGCAHSEHSEHCRTELRESNPKSWDPRGTINSMKVNLAVKKPDDSNYGTVIGQVKIDDDVSTKPLAELFYDQSGTIRIGVSQIPGVSSLKMTEVGHIAVGQTFNYELKYSNGLLSVTIGGGKEQVMDTGKINSPKSYFKVGNYNQGDSPSEVWFYSIDIHHS
jgi:hypothetical protein